ncbi:DUF488 family protein [Gloeobacter morelensis]|uniref:DUF488 domain-containing protein n=1 Tax=Gloeobacter morelensis MG652769 TaxID=2781736 RepID=A0ABY3PIX4_9CYAN|nr:DUF488 domain-containing protein [Gloeobacter morelensis]UFP93616.1 DUF488 domain-containing protein [Gloeobacter morelensis MG652769]
MKRIYTLGFTKRSAANFFNAIRSAGIKRLLDVRLNNVSQLSGFAKKDDLAFFLEAICNAEYVHEPLLAPTKEMLDTYKKGKVGWEAYETSFLKLIRQRRIEDRIDRSIFDLPTVLLCSEATPEHCHRRLVLEYLKDKWKDFSIVHL